MELLAQLGLTGRAKPEFTASHAGAPQAQTRAAARKTGQWASEEENKHKITKPDRACVNSSPLGVILLWPSAGPSHRGPELNLKRARANGDHRSAGLARPPC